MDKELLDKSVYVADKDFSMKYRTVYDAIVKLTVESTEKTLPTKTHIIEALGLATVKYKKWVRRRISDMLVMLARNGYIRITPVYNTDHRYIHNIYEVLE